MIKDVLKPKSKTEIDDLKERGFCKKGEDGQWKFQIDLSDLIVEYGKHEQTSIYKKNLINILNKKANDIKVVVGEQKQQLYIEIIKEFEKLSEAPHPDDLDFLMDKLYDWCDDNDVWVETL